MRHRSRRFRRSGRQKSRRIRWTGPTTFEIDQTLQASALHGPEYMSFWAKRPASTQSGAGGSLQVGLVANSNEPVDETLVRTLLSVQGALVVPGTTGVAPLCSVAYGIIPFDGGDQPEFYDFAIFQNNISLVSCPSPFVDSDDDWTFRNVYGNSGREVVIFDNTLGPAQFTESKAMRKLPAGTGLLFVIGVLALNELDTLTATVTVSGDIRMAFKSGFSV